MSYRKGELKMKRKLLCALLCAAMLLTLAACGAAEKAAEAPAETPAAAETQESAPFAYEHDPRENPDAMKDIIENPDAVYGFSPDPESSRLGPYAEYDWTNPEVVEQGRQDRIAYHESLDSLYDILYEMRDEGKSIEEMARTVSAERNRLRLESYRDDPEALEKAKQSNLDTYGDENGPSADSLYEKYGSWETVMQKAFGTNAGMDACVGLYDDYYPLYIELGMIPG